MEIKRLNLNGITYIDKPRDGNGEWYFGMDFPSGDPYEAEEIYHSGRMPEGTTLYLIHYPDGETIMPVPKRPGLCLTAPVSEGNLLYLLGIDFAEQMIRIHAFDGATRSLSLLQELPLSSVKDCYNLMLHTRPVTLSRQPNDGTIDIIWPERVTIPVGKTETFNFRYGDRLYLTAWFEDPDYREETVVRDIRTGEELERYPGDIHIMPDGSYWHTY